MKRLVNPHLENAMHAVTVPRAAIFTLMRLLIVVCAPAFLQGCFFFQPPVTDATRVRGIRANDSVLVVQKPYKDWRVEIPAGVYPFMPGFSHARSVAYSSPAAFRKRETLLPFLWNYHRFAWLIVPTDANPRPGRLRWAVWSNGASDYLGDDFKYEIRPVNSAGGQTASQR